MKKIDIKVIGQKLMGLNSSTKHIISFEVAISKVNADELKRIYKWFMQLSFPHDAMSLESFQKYVFRNRLPESLTKVLFNFLANGNRLEFHDFFIFISLLTYGTEHERMKLFTHLFGASNSVYVLTPRRKIEAFIMDCFGHLPKELNTVFKESEFVPKTEFLDSLCRFITHSSVFQWLMQEHKLFSFFNSLPSSEFYNSLERTSNFSRDEIAGIEEAFLKIKHNSEFHKVTLNCLLSLFNPVVPDFVTEALFNAMDDNHDGEIDFKELIDACSHCCRGPLEDRYAFLYKVFDLDKDNSLNMSEVENLLYVTGTLCSIPFDSVDKFYSFIMATSGQDKAGSIDLTQFISLMENGYLPNGILDYFFQIFHIYFGLTPTSKHEELMIAKGWLRHENSKGMVEGSKWYAIDMYWFKRWLCMKEGSNGSASPKKLQTVPFNSLKRQASYVKKIKRKIDFSAINSSSKIVLSSIKDCYNPIDNTLLVDHSLLDKESLTYQKQNVRLKPPPSSVRGKNYDFIPASVWWFLHHIYGGGPVIERKVVKDDENNLDVELNKITVKIYMNSNYSSNMTKKIKNANNWLNMLSGFNTFNASATHQNPNQGKNRVLAFVGTFSCDELFSVLLNLVSSKLKLSCSNFRLWRMKSEQELTLITDSYGATFSSLEITDLSSLFLEIRNGDSTWPEESKSHSGAAVVTVGGTSGLDNLGNTCYMNSILQCLSNTTLLTRYFLEELHLHELNRSNPLGFNGAVAIEYAKLIEDMWNGSHKTVSPLPLRAAINKQSHLLSDFSQHDSTEFLSLILDGLHEDLNRISDVSSSTVHHDSDGKTHDDVAAEHWNNHLSRNQSIIVDLFHGLLRSTVCCNSCAHESVRFDPFNVLSVPVPSGRNIRIQVKAVHYTGQRLRRYSLSVNESFTLRTLASHLVDISRMKSIQFFEFANSRVKIITNERDSIKLFDFNSILAYEIPNAGEENENRSFRIGSPSHIVAYNRRVYAKALYFTEIDRNETEIFGIPVILPTTKSSGPLTNKEIYELVLQQVFYLIPTFSKEKFEKLKYTSEYPFSLCYVTSDCTTCSICHWSKFCLGCEIPPNNEVFDNAGCTSLAIDWNPHVLHLNYDFSLESKFEDYHYDDEDICLDTEITLENCIEAFSEWETLSESYLCQKCCTPQPCKKKIDLWKVPPILVIQLNRFEEHFNHYEKATQPVKFPINDFYLSLHVDEGSVTRNGRAVSFGCNSFSLEDTKYNLYALICHYGSILSGHYVAYAKNTNGVWTMYNDSMSKTIHAAEIESLSEACYVLFYERENLDCTRYLPKFNGRELARQETNISEGSSRPCKLM